MGAWSESRTLTGLTWGVVKDNLYMLLFPVVAAVLAAVLVLAVVGIGLGLLGLTTTAEDYLATGQVEESPALFAGIVTLIAAGYLGTLITQICMAGLADVRLDSGRSDLWCGPWVAVATDQPLAACMASQPATSTSRSFST